MNAPLQKLLTTMLPTEEEKGKIIEAQMETPDIPLGTAEQFLITLSSITELYPRLSLWAFKLDYETTESVSVAVVADSSCMSCFSCFSAREPVTVLPVIPSIVFFCGI